MTPEEKALQQDVRRRLEYYFPKISKSESGLNVSIRDKDFLLQFVGNKGVGDRAIK